MLTAEMRQTPLPAALGRFAGAAGTGGPARVLVVDDDERNLLAIQTVIEDIAEVVVARSGEEALRHLLKGDFAVILLDVYMPGMDGYEAAQIIRSREQTKRIPIVFLSAVNKEAEHLMRGYSMGAVDYVFKPVDPVVIRSKVNVFVDLYTMRREIERNAAHTQQLLDANLRANAERLRAEQELRLAEQRQAAIIQSLPIVLYLEGLADLPRVPRFVSGNFATVTGYDFAELQRSPDLWVERLHPDDRERVVAALAARSAGGSMSVEYRWCCANGEYRHFLDQAVLLRDAAGAGIEYAGTLLDVTDRRELETQLAHARKMDAIGQLTGGIAHDFNNLLTAVLGGVGLIERRIPLDESQQRIVEMMRHAAEQGAELVRRLLAFARRQKLEPSAVAVEQLAGAVGDLLAHTLGGLVQLEWNVPAGTGQVWADAGQLELALMNLIINARDAMPDGGIVTVTATDREVAAGDGDVQPGRYVVLTVADTGCGIPSELVDQVLEPFFTTKEVGKGTGLGLSMVYGFVRQSGGALRIDSEPGDGTRIELWLPMVAQAEDATVRANATGPTGTVPARRLRILLVDDHPGVRATTAALLEDLGHEVIEAECSETALHRITELGDRFDVLVSDYAMPRQSGVELLERARLAVPALPGIIITGYADAQSIARRPGDVAILGKPFTPDQLAGALAAAAREQPTVVAIAAIAS
jgi:signal transduction histidine kinase